MPGRSAFWAAKNAAPGPAGHRNASRKRRQARPGRHQSVNYGFPGARFPMTPQNSITPLVFVTGGVVSSLGKGISAASLAAILEA